MNKIQELYSPKSEGQGLQTVRGSQVSVSVLLGLFFLLRLLVLCIQRRTQDRERGGEKDGGEGRDVGSAEPYLDGHLTHH